MHQERVRLDGLTLISRYLNLHRNQVRKLYAITVPEHLRIPVFRLSPTGGKNGRLSAWVDELDAWQDRMSTRRLYESDST